MAREILGGPRDPGRASYQIVVIQCEDCGRGFQHATGEQIALDPAIVEMCHCDAQNIAIAVASTDTQTDTPDDVAQSDAHRRTAGNVASTGVRDEASDTVGSGHAHMDGPRRPFSDTTVSPTVHPHLRSADGLGTSSQSALESAAHRPKSAANGPGASGQSAPESAAHRPKSAASAGRGGLKRARATQDTPPAIRREVFWRDGGRCIVPGCRNAAYVDLHHLDLRSEGGSHDPNNLVVLCGAHHGALHRGRLRIEGKVSTGLRVRHADGTAYGFRPSPALADASAAAFAALRNLSFPERTARAALERALATAPADASKETLLRAALVHTARH